VYDQLVRQEIEFLNSPGKNFRLKEKAKRERQEELERNGGKVIEPIPTVMTVLLERGTWLHIGIRDYRDYVLQILPEPAELEEETDEQISGIPAAQMTEGDKSMVAVKRAAKRKLAESMFNFMSKQELIPHNAGVMSSEFVHKGSAGHSVTLNKDTVYVLIDGRACMQIFLNSNPTSDAGPSVGGGRIIVGTERGPEEGDPFWAYKAAQTVTVARREMPIILLEAGTIVNLVKEHYEIGKLKENKDDRKRDGGFSTHDAPFGEERAEGQAGGNTHHGHDARGHGGHGHAEDGSGSGSGSFLPLINLHRKHGNGNNNSNTAGAGGGGGGKTSTVTESDNRAGYSLRFMNETAITYLAIPRKTFNAAMRDLSAQHSQEIVKQLESASKLCSMRLKPLTGMCLLSVCECVCVCVSACIRNVYVYV